jgi:hypothetical protein
MEKDIFEFTVSAETQGEAGAGTQALADRLREADGVIEVDRLKPNHTTMDLGSVVQIIASSGATLAIAQGVASWLRARRGVKLRIGRDGKSGSIKVLVEGIDPEAAMRITELVRKG